MFLDENVPCLSVEFRICVISQKSGFGPLNRALGSEVLPKVQEAHASQGQGGFGMACL